MADCVLHTIILLKHWDAEKEKYCLSNQILLMDNNFENIIKKQLSMAMCRENLNNVPQFPLLSKISIRPFQAGDDKTWLNIQIAADRYSTFAPHSFYEIFGKDVSLLKKRVRFLTDSENNPIGTAAAWFWDLEGQHYGLIHWVAIIPEWRGRGVAKPLMSTICNLLKELGHDKAILYTHSMRYPAIKLYYRFGFVPLIRNKKEQIAWDVILEKIKSDYRVQ